jgi:hypothetical protein
LTGISTRSWRLRWLSVSPGGRGLSKTSNKVESAIDALQPQAAECAAGSASGPSKR